MTTDLLVPRTQQENCRLVAGSRFGLVMLTCPDNEPDDLVAFLDSLPYEVVRVEEDKRYFGGSANLSDPSVMFEANSFTCGLTNRFNNFPQINPANWGLDRLSL